MIDTVKLAPADVRLRGPVAASWRETVYPSGGSVVNPRDGRKYKKATRRRLVHLPTGLRVYAMDAKVVSIEFSAPRQLERSNGHLIASQVELDAALAAALSTVREIADFHSMAFAVRRLDLSLHLPIDPADAVGAYRDFIYPGIQKPPTLRSGESLWWEGTNLEVRLYDKWRELNRFAGKVLRLEFRLSGNVLSREFGGEVTRLDFAQCYEVFRRLAQRLEPKRLPRLSKIADLLAYCEQGGVAAMAYWLRGKGPITVRAIRREVTGLRLEYDDINLMAHLPESGPPPPIHVDVEGAEGVEEPRIERDTESLDLDPVAD